MPRIALINPPLSSVEQPFLALAALQGHLKLHGYHDVTIYDYSQTIIDRFLTSSYLRTVLAGLEERVANFERISHMDTLQALAYEAALVGKAAAAAAVPRIDAAVTALRSPEGFFDYHAYCDAMLAVDLAFEAISGLHFPQLLARRNYTGSVLQDLDTDDELQAFIRTPGRCLFAPAYEDGLLDDMVRTRPDIVGLSATFQDQFLPALVLVRILRERLPQAHIEMGGAFLASRTGEIRSRPWLFDDLDSMVIGEGETALLALVQACERGGGLDEVPNLIRRVDGRVTEAGSRVRERLEALGAPDYSGYDISKYLAPGWDVLYDPTRGCYWNRCRFCTVSQSTKGAARQREAGRTVDHMEELCQRHHTSLISFSADAVPVPLMRAVSEEILRRGLDVGWSSEFILDRQLDRPTLELFAAAGCLLLLFGFESAVPRIVRAMHKGTLPARTRRIIRDCSEAGIAVLLHVMVGFPGETEEELEETLRFIEQMGQHVDYYELNAFHLDAGAPVYSQPERVGIVEVGRLKRAFNGQSTIPYRVTAGLSIEQAAERVSTVRTRIERALGFQGRPYLYQDGAQLHHYLKAYGRRGIRGLRTEQNRAVPSGGVVLAQGVVPVQSPYDLAAMTRNLAQAALHQQRAFLTGDGDSWTLWQGLNKTSFRPEAAFTGVFDFDKGPDLLPLDPGTYRLVEVLWQQPEAFSQLARLAPGRRSAMESRLAALAQIGLVEGRGGYERNG